MSDDNNQAADDAGDPIESAAELLADDSQRRLWLRAIVSLIQLRTRESDPSHRVQYALDQMQIAACERAARILRSDLPPA